MLMQLYGFEIGLQKMRKERTRFEFEIKIATPSEGLSTIETSSGIDDGLRRKLERSELKLFDANQEIAALKVALNPLKNQKALRKLMQMKQIDKHRIFRIKSQHIIEPSTTSTRFIRSSSQRREFRIS